MTEVVEVEAVQKETLYEFGDWTIREGFADSLFLCNKKVAICLTDVSSRFWFHMNGEEIHLNPYGWGFQSLEKSSTTLTIAKFIMSRGVLRKPVFTTPSEEFVLVWRDWEIISKKYGELLVTNKECQIMLKMFSTDVHTTIRNVQRSFFVQDE